MIRWYPWQPSQQHLNETNFILFFFFKHLKVKMHFSGRVVSKNRKAAWPSGMMEALLTSCGKGIQDWQVLWPDFAD